MAMVRISSGNSGILSWSDQTPGFSLAGKWLGVMPAHMTRTKSDVGAVETADGGITSFFMVKQLTEELEGAVRIGGAIALVYLGLVPTKKGNSMHKFDIEAEETDQIQKPKPQQSAVAVTAASAAATDTDDEVPF